MMPFDLQAETRRCVAHSPAQRGEGECWTSLLSPSRAVEGVSTQQHAANCHVTAWLDNMNWLVTADYEEKLDDGLHESNTIFFPSAMTDKDEDVEGSRTTLPITSVESKRAMTYTYPDTDGTVNEGKILSSPHFQLQSTANVRI
jgi:hypothetical protein